MLKKILHVLVGVLGISVCFSGSTLAAEPVLIGMNTPVTGAAAGEAVYFMKAAKPDIAEPLYEYFCKKMLDNGVRKAEKGIFGADMKVSLLNDGPVTIDIDTRDLKY